MLRLKTKASCGEVPVRKRPHSLYYSSISYYCYFVVVIIIIITIISAGVKLAASSIVVMEADSLQREKEN